MGEKVSKGWDVDAQEFEDWKARLTLLLFLAKLNVGLRK
jgi:hypothetical protein